MAAVKEEVFDSIQQSSVKEYIALCVNQILATFDIKKKVEKENAEINEACNRISKTIENATLKNKLGILYDYNNKYMELIKNYEDQLKLVVSFQSELRNEITKLFTSSISEASKALKESGLDEKIQAQYLRTYIDSQIECINMSKRYFQESVLNSANKIQNEMTESVKEEENIPIYAKQS